MPSSRAWARALTRSLTTSVRANVRANVRGNERQRVTTHPLTLHAPTQALPFYAMDQALAQANSNLTFVWKLWFIEAVDFSSIV